MDTPFLAPVAQTLFDFLLNLHRDGKVPLVGSNSTDGVAAHINQVLFPSDVMAYMTTRRVCCFPPDIVEKLGTAGIVIEFTPVGKNIDVTYSNEARTVTVTYRIPVVLQFQSTGR